jgi:hypothetical protein
MIAPTEELLEAVMSVESMQRLYKKSGLGNAQAYIDRIFLCIFCKNAGCFKNNFTMLFQNVTVRRELRKLSVVQRKTDSLYAFNHYTSACPHIYVQLLHYILYTGLVYVTIPSVSHARLNIFDCQNPRHDQTVRPTFLLQGTLGGSHAEPLKRKDWKLDWGMNGFISFSASVVYERRRLVPRFQAEGTLRPEASVGRAYLSSFNGDVMAGRLNHDST